MMDPGDEHECCIAVAKAARLLGLDRHELQRLIRDGELETFEGMVHLEALKERFPQLGLDSDPLFERLKLIRQTAFSRRVRERVMPEKDELEQRLRRRESELSVQTARADGYEEILQELARLLTRLQASGDEGRRSTAAEISRWLLGRMNGA